MSVEYFYENDLNMLYNAAVNNSPGGGEQHKKMLELYNNLVAYISHIEHWKSTALQLAKNYGVRIHSLEQRIEELEEAISNQSTLVYKFENMASDLQSENDLLKNNPEAEKYYYQKWVEGKQRIAELEQERRWIHQDKTMIAKKDGDSWCFVLPDFVNLHESEAEFVDGILYRFIEEIYKRLLPPQDGE